MAQGVELIGLYAGTWLIGFLAFFAPGGIGVRDGLILLVLGLFLASPLPLAIAVLARLQWVIAEIICALVSSMVYHYTPSTLLQSQDAPSLNVD